MRPSRMTPTGGPRGSSRLTGVIPHTARFRSVCVSPICGFATYYLISDGALSDDESSDQIGRES